MLNRVIIMGRIVADPELRTTPSGISVCTIRVAVDRFARAGEQREADFFDVVTWRQQAEFVTKYFSKGRMIAVEGRLQTRKWKDKFEQSRVSTEIVADNVSFCGDRREDAHTPDESGGTQYGAQPYGGAPRYNAAPQQAAQAPSFPGVSDFSELSDDEDDQVPF